MKAKSIQGSVAALALAMGTASAQQMEKDAAVGLQVGPATVAPHHSRNDYPTSIPEGATYHIVVTGDTLWDLSARFLGNAYLWPQIWDANKYISDAHWIWPGDPLILPKLALIADQAGTAGAVGTAEGAGGEGTGGVGEGGMGGAAGAALLPVTEETSLQCADYIIPDREDESLIVFGSELGADKVALSERDIVYLNKGSNSGIKAGELYSLQHLAYRVTHPISGKKMGHKIRTVGWLQVILVQENTSIAVIEQSCADIHAGVYLKPFEKVNVPLVVPRPVATRLTPPSGKLSQYVIDLAADALMAGEGHFVTIDAGSEAGVAPGNVFSIYRINYPSVPSPRNVIGELTVVSVRDRTSLAKITYSADAIVIGDPIELR